MNTDRIGRELDRIEKDQQFQSAVCVVGEGILPCEEMHPAQRLYRRYCAALVVFTESPDVMRMILAEPILRISFFRVFGYRGEVRFSMMPSVQLRDLPLLDIGRDAHLGYGVMLGTAEMLPNRKAMALRPIAIGARTFFNQHSVVEGGTRIGAECSIGIRGLVQGDCTVGDRVEIGDFARIGRGAILGDGARIGHGAIVGEGSIVDAGIAVDEGAEVPAHHRLTAGGLFPRPHRRLAA